MTDDSKKTHESASEPGGVRKFIDEKSSQIKGDLKTIVKDDLIGVSSWKSSKIGSLLGVGIAVRSIGSVGRSLVGSSSRLSSLFTAALAQDNVPEVLTDDPRERFQLSMEVNGKTDRDIQIGIRNTFWSFWLYASLIIFLGLILAYSMYAWPPRDLMQVFQRVGLLPFLLAMLVKHGYTNWMFTNRSYASIFTYFKSFDFLPKIKAR